MRLVQSFLPTILSGAFNHPMKTIEIIVAPNGDTRLETCGFKGPACREASAFLEQALGRQAAELLTCEFHQSTTHSETLEERP